jgi:hypothetical protein
MSVYAENNDIMWEHFLHHVTVIYTADERYRNKTIDYALTDELGKHGVINILGTVYIEFDTEEDAVAFKLKWL